jgi:hypothetical protein
VVSSNTIFHNENPNKAIDKLIYYASKLMNSAENNYTTIKKKH